MTKKNSVACHITSDLDFDKEGCVIQIEWIDSAIHKATGLVVPGGSMI